MLPLLSLLALGSPLPYRVAEPCLHYGPTEVTLDGDLIRRIYPGPPNYESVTAGDSAETALIVTLSSPVCVTVDSAIGGPDDEPEAGIEEIQLAIGADSVWEQLKRVPGSRMRVTGTLFHAISGHHHTRILLWVSRIRAV
jgi:hypothetical protein